MTEALEKLALPRHVGTRGLKHSAPSGEAQLSNLTIGRLAKERARARGWRGCGAHTREDRNKSAASKGAIVAPRKI